MRRVTDFPKSQFSWVQPKVGERRFELRTGADVVATLVFRSFTGSLATAETAEGSMTFKRVGFLNARVTIRDAGGLEDVAVYHPRLWGGGELLFNDGQEVHWRSTNFWGTSWAFTDGANQVLVDFKPGLEHEKFSDMFKIQATLTINPMPALQTRGSILLPLGLYLLILQQDDSTASAGAVVATM